MSTFAKKTIFYLMLFVIGIFLGSQIAKAQSSPQNTLLYEISGKDLKQSSYLYGTFHVLCANDLILTQTIKDKFKVCGQLVLELDMDDPALASSMQANMNFANGKTLKDYLKQDEYALVNQFFKDSLNMPLDQMINIKPFMLSSMLYPKYLGCTPASWEITLMQLAKENKIEVMGLETLEEQMKAVDAMPFELQAKSLFESISNYENGKSLTMKLLALYKSQKIEDLYQVSKEYFDEEMEGMEKIMLADRNQNWISKISRLSKEKPTFYAVGAGHLGGKNGVIALLRKEGYTVTPIENKTDLQVSESNAMDMQNEAARQLIRKWKPDESMVPQLVEDMIESVRKQNAEQAKQLESQKEMLAQLIGNVTLEYNADNTYLIAVPNNPQSGTWKLSDDHKQIIRKDNNGKESIHEILEISDKKLVILNSEKKKMIYVAL